MRSSVVLLCLNYGMDLAYQTAKRRRILSSLRLQIESVDGLCRGAMKRMGRLALAAFFMLWKHACSRCVGGGGGGGGVG